MSRVIRYDIHYKIIINKERYTDILYIKNVTRSPRLSQDFFNLILYIKMDVTCFRLNY